MYFKKIISLFLCLVSFTSISQANQQGFGTTFMIVALGQTAIYFISSPGDFVGLGKNRAYWDENEGYIKICSKARDLVEVNYWKEGSNGPLLWHIKFQAPKGQELKP